MLPIKTWTSNIISSDSTRNTDFKPDLPNILALPASTASYSINIRIPISFYTCSSGRNNLTNLRRGDAKLHVRRNEPRNYNTISLESGYR